MPKRKRIVRVPSDEVQGKDSWVLMAHLTVAEMRTTRKLALQSQRESEIAKEAGTAPPEDSVDMFEVGVDILKSHVKEWNWVDDEGEPLPQPKDDPSVIETLSDPESTFLSDWISGSDTKTKN